MKAFIFSIGFLLSAFLLALSAYAGTRWLHMKAEDLVVWFSIIICISWARDFVRSLNR